MKYVFKLIFATIVVIFGIVLFTFKTIWTFDAQDVKDIWREYKNFVRTIFWKAFRVNIYKTSPFKKF